MLITLRKAESVLGVSYHLEEGVRGLWGVSGGVRTNL